MRDVHAFLVLSPRAFNERTSLVIGLPMTTAEYNAGNPFAVAIGPATAERPGRRATCCATSRSRSTGESVAHRPIR
jgi:mRNA interferase MazF